MCAMLIQLQCGIFSNSLSPKKKHANSRKKNLKSSRNPCKLCKHQGQSLGPSAVNSCNHCEGTAENGHSEATIKRWVYKQGQSMSIRATAKLKNNACLFPGWQHIKWPRESGSRPPSQMSSTRVDTLWPLSFSWWGGGHQPAITRVGG